MIAIFNRFKNQLIEKEKQEILRQMNSNAEIEYKKRLKTLEDKVKFAIRDVFFDFKNVAHYNFYVSTAKKAYGETKSIDILPTAKENDDINMILDEQLKRIDNIFKGL